MFLYRTILVVALVAAASSGCGGVSRSPGRPVAGAAGQSGDDGVSGGLAGAGGVGGSANGEGGQAEAGDMQESGGRASRGAAGDAATGGIGAQGSGGQSAQVGGAPVATGSTGAGGFATGGSATGPSGGTGASPSGGGVWSSAGAAPVPEAGRGGSDCDGGTCPASCGDGKIEGREVCDDGPTGRWKSGDGCSADCTVLEFGWICRNAGTPCTPRCGDGFIVSGQEQCDDGNKNPGDGCSRTCLIELRHTCTGQPSVCSTTSCGNGIVEGTEMCDRGAANGLFYGDGKGCTKACTPEPLCRDPDGGPTHECTSICGDGVRLGSEECDDGNRTRGDGCSDECRIEPGNSCTAVINNDAVPCPTGSGDCMLIPVIARDFKGQNEVGGHPDFFYYGATGINGEQTCCVPDASCDPDDTDCPDTANDVTAWCRGLVQGHLDDSGKPQLSAHTTCECQFTDWDDTGILKSCTGASLGAGPKGHDIIAGPVQVIESAGSFAQWYSNDHPADATVRTALALTRNGAVYTYASSDGRTVTDDIHEGQPLTAGFFPVDGLGSSEPMCNLWGYWLDWPGCEGRQWDALANGGAGAWVDATGTYHNFYFTTEARYIFVYQGGEKLSFFGDDDAWVFVNGILAVDLGGTHRQLEGSVTLSNQGDPIEDRNFGLQANRAYEIAVFQAERQPRDSNYRLTLSGFKIERSQCGPSCGDGVKTLMEECDDGKNNLDNAYGGCQSDCTFGPFCGDGVVNGSELCDDGLNTTLDYGVPLPACAPGCVPPPRCGDGKVDDVEECDDGDGRNIDGVGRCSSECQLNPSG